MSSRILRGAERFETPIPEIPVEPPGVSTGIRGRIRTPLPMAPEGQGTASRIRRSVTGKIVEPAVPGQHQTPLPQSPVQGVTVMCPHCQQMYRTVARQVAELVLCIHCGAAHRVTAPVKPPSR